MLYMFVGIVCGLIFQFSNCINHFYFAVPNCNRRYSYMHQWEKNSQQTDSRTQRRGVFGIKKAHVRV